MQTGSTGDRRQQVKSAENREYRRRVIGAIDRYVDSSFRLGPEQVVPLLPEITAAIEPGLAGWRRRDLVRFNRIMSEANRALRDQDWVMLRDLLHFELRRLFTR